MTTNRIQEAIRKARALGGQTEGIREMLTRYPYLLTYDEAGEELAKSGTLPVLREVNSASLLAQQGVPPERNHTPSKLNRSAVKAFALEVSDKKKGGKFERVGSEHLRWVEAELENIIQGICRNPHSDDDLSSSGWDFLNWKQVAPRVREILNRAVRRAIFSRVKNQPSVGKTIK